MQYILCGGQLYKRSYDEVHLRCLKKEEAKRIMEEVHQGIYGHYMNGNMLAKKILRIKYYWNTMETNCINFVKCFHDYQTHANLNNVPHNDLHSMISSWPFSVQGIYVNGRIALKASNGHKYIFVAIDYFTKQGEAASYSMLNAKHVA